MGLLDDIVDLGKWESFMFRKSFGLGALLLSKELSSTKCLIRQFPTLGSEEDGSRTHFWRMCFKIFLLVISRNKMG